MDDGPGFAERVLSAFKALVLIMGWDSLLLGLVQFGLVGFLVLEFTFFFASSGVFFLFTTLFFDSSILQLMGQPWPAIFSPLVMGGGRDTGNAGSLVNLGSIDHSGFFIYIYCLSWEKCFLGEKLFNELLSVSA